MLNLARVVVTGLIMAMFHSVNFPPNIVNSNDLEKTSDNNLNKNFYVFSVAIFCLQIFYWMSNLYYYGNLGLNIFEWSMFFMFVVGWLLRLVSYFTLGEFFMFKIGVKKNHELIEHGPYKYLIHPSYTGGIIMSISFSLYVQMYYLLSAIFVIISLYGCYKRILIEENIMREKFGRKYDDYIKNRWRLFPYIY